MGIANSQRLLFAVRTLLFVCVFGFMASTAWGYCHDYGTRRTAGEGFFYQDIGGKGYGSFWSLTGTIQNLSGKSWQRAFFRAKLIDRKGKILKTINFYIDGIREGESHVFDEPFHSSKRLYACEVKIEFRGGVPE